MRHAVRIQPYLPADLCRKLRAYAAAQSLTASAVVVAALTDYLDGGAGDEALTARRLDGLTHAVEELQRDVGTLGVGLGRFVRYSFYAAPTKVDEKVVRRAEALYREFLARVGEQYRAGGSFTRQVFPARQLSAPAAAHVDGETTGGAGEGQR